MSVGARLLHVYLMSEAFLLVSTISPPYRHQQSQPANPAVSKQKLQHSQCTKWMKNKSKISIWFQFSAVFGLFRIRSTMRRRGFFFCIHLFALFSALLIFQSRRDDDFTSVCVYLT